MDELTSIRVIFVVLGKCFRDPHWCHPNPNNCLDILKETSIQIFWIVINIT